jgi:2'-5' RNA ligase
MYECTNERPGPPIPEKISGDLMAKSFVFLEIGDPEIDALISGIRTIATGKRPKAVPHVTLRGPYSKQVPAEQLDRYARILSSDPLVLNGIGSFSRPHHITVFVRVQHSKLQQVWWKPDFPPKKFGFNPHVTLYEGDDIARGQRLLDFLTSEDIKLLTWKYFHCPLCFRSQRLVYPRKRDRGTLPGLGQQTGGKGRYLGQATTSTRRPKQISTSAHCEFWPQIGGALHPTPALHPTSAASG